MTSLDSSVVMKWFKPGERYEAEAHDLRARMERNEVAGVISELVGLEIVRGLKNTQLQQPSLGITDATIDGAFTTLLTMIQQGRVLECPVYHVKVQAKEIILTLGLYMADAVQLGTAVYLSAQYFVTDDRHFFTPPVVAYAARFGVRVINLPDLIAALNAARGTGTP